MKNLTIIFTLVTTVLLAGCGGKAVPERAYLPDADVTIRAADGSWTLNSGGFFAPQRIADKPFSVLRKDLFLPALSLKTRYSTDHVGHTEDLINYKKVLKLGKRNEVPHYEVLVDIDGETQHGLLVFAPVLESKQGFTSNIYKVTLANQGKAEIGDIRFTYGTSNRQSLEVIFWILWWAAEPLK